MISRLLVSDLLTRDEKAQFEGIRVAGDKGDFEQERLGRPVPAWPFY